jgi:hypothetical protein
MLRQKYTWFIIAAYLILMIGFAFYWGDNFTKFVHFKGDDVGVIVTFSILLSCLFFTMLAFNGVKFKGWLILILPIAITGLSVFTGTVLLFTTGISGTPQQPYLAIPASLYNICHFSGIDRDEKQKGGGLRSTLKSKLLHFLLFTLNF